MTMVIEIQRGVKMPPITRKKTKTVKAKIEKLKIGDSVHVKGVGKASYCWRIVEEVFGKHSAAMRRLGEKDYGVWRIK